MRLEPGVREAIVSAVKAAYSASGSSDRASTTGLLEIGPRVREYCMNFFVA